MIGGIDEEMMRGNWTWFLSFLTRNLVAELPAPIPVEPTVEQAADVPLKFWQFSLRDGLLVTTYVAFACAFYPLSPFMTFGLAWIAVPGILRYRANCCVDRSFRNFAGMIIAFVGSLAAAAFLTVVAFCGMLLIGFFFVLLLSVLHWCGVNPYRLERIMDYCALQTAIVLILVIYALLEYASWPRGRAIQTSSVEGAGPVTSSK